MTATMSTEETIVLVAITRKGAAQAARLAALLPQAQILVSEKFADAFAGLPNPLASCRSAASPASGRGGSCDRAPLQSRTLSEWIGPLFAQYREIVFFVSLGAVVRLIAPHLKGKDKDPAVLVIDEAAQFVIPVLSGHLGGANACAERLAALLGARPVLTTASDVSQTIAVDILGRELGWRVEASKEALTRAAAAVVNGEPVAFVQEVGKTNWWPHATPLAGNITLFKRIEEVPPGAYAAVLWVTQREISAAMPQAAAHLIVYRPPATRLALGIGCDRGTSLATLQAALEQALALTGIDGSRIDVATSIDKKSDEAAILQLAARHDWPLSFFSAEMLATVEVPNPSATVLKHMGTPAVSEAAALLAVAPGGRLLLEKFKYLGSDGKNATLSIAERMEE